MEKKEVRDARPEKDEDVGIQVHVELVSGRRVVRFFLLLFSN